MEYRIALIPGDGIGPEIVSEAKKVLDKVCEKYHHTFTYSEVLLGGASIDVHGVPLTEEAIATAKSSDAVLMGSIGGDAKTSPWYKLEPSKRPEAGLLAIRKALNLFANLRPAYLYKELEEACPIKKEVIGENGFDMIIVRELTGGLYFGERKTIEEDGVKKAIDTLSYNENEIRRIAVKAFDIAMKRKKKVTSVDKANVLDSSRLWRKVVEEVAADYPEVTLEHMLVDNCAMQLVHDPAQFDVSSPRICSEIFYLMRQVWSQDLSECFLLQASTRQNSVCMSQAMDQHRILQDRIRQIRSRLFFQQQ